MKDFLKIWNKWVAELPKTFFRIFLPTKGDNSQLATIETLEEELGKRNRRIDDILNEQNSTIDQYKRQIGELELNIQDREHKLAHTNEKLEQAEQKIDVKWSKFSFNKFILFIL